MINFPETIKSEPVEHKYVWLMFFQNDASLKIPVMSIPLGDGYAPFGWACKYPDLNDEGKLMYNYMKKMFPNLVIMLITGGRIE